MAQGVADIDDTRIGDCDVYEDEILVGHTLGGVMYAINREWTDVTVDKYGSSAVDKALTGTKFTIKASLAAPITENLARAYPEGTYASGVQSDKLGIGADAGYRARTGAKPVRLHPRYLADDVHDEDIYMHLGFASGSIEQEFKIDAQRKLEIEWEALVDESKPNGSRLGQIGDDVIS